MVWLPAPAASGPAFEGAKIQCGMRGLPGAIDHVKYENGKWQYTTIENEKPTGLCGSGLIDLIAELLLHWAFGRKRNFAQWAGESGYLCTCAVRGITKGNLSYTERYW